MMTPKERAAVSIQNESETVSSLSMMRTAMQLALEALESCVEKFYAMQSTGVIGALPMQAVKAAQAITALREALAEQAEQEPVGEVVMESMGVGDAQIVRFRMNGRIPPVGTKLYAAPVSVEAAVLSEREACAKVCEEEHDRSKFGANGMNCAAAIRARSNNG